MKLSSEQKERVVYFYHEWIEPLIAAGILALLIRTFLVQPFKIPTGSMRPTLIESDRILVNKLLYRFRDPQRGDIIVFKYPPDQKRDFIKRLIAIGGETVEIKRGDIYINGEELTDPEIIDSLYYYNKEDWAFGASGQVLEVPEGNYFVLGDNSVNSSDSRNWGFVPRKNVVGRAFFTYWPLSRLKRLQ
jgi:signal peptidase I